MKIVVLSGKGGTGKTFVSVNLAATAAKAVYVDCDVEAPNGHLYFELESRKQSLVYVPIPKVNKEKCIGCRTCVDFCKFNAMAFIKDKPLVFEEICHGCGGCVKLCPQKAIEEVDKTIGIIEEGQYKNVHFLGGKMNIGEASGVPIISALLEVVKDQEGLVVVDAPPGSACLTMESIKDADFCLLVAEPTLFGAHNLNMVYELTKLFNKPYGVVLNKWMEGMENPSEIFCLEHNIPILARIPFEDRIGALHGSGEIVVEHEEKYKEIFFKLLDEAQKEASK